MSQCKHVALQSQTRASHSPGKFSVHCLGNLHRISGIAKHVGQDWAQLRQDVLGNGEEQGPVRIQDASCFHILGGVTKVALRRGPRHRTVGFGVEHPQQADGKVEFLVVTAFEQWPCCCFGIGNGENGLCPAFRKKILKHTFPRALASVAETSGQAFDRSTDTKY